MPDKESYRKKVEERKVFIPGQGIQERSSDKTHFTSEAGEYENGNAGNGDESSEDEQPEQQNSDTEDQDKEPQDSGQEEYIHFKFDEPVPLTPADETTEDDEATSTRVEVRTPEWAKALEDKLDEDQLKALSEMPRDYLLFPRHHRPITIEWMLGDHGTLKMDYDIVYLWEGQDTGDGQYPDRVVVRTRSDNVFIPTDRKDVRFRIITEGDGANIRFQGYRESYRLQDDPFGYTMFSILGNIERDSEQSSLSFSTGFIK